MIYQIERIKRDVRVALDEDVETVSLLEEGDEEVERLAGLTESKIAEAVDRVHVAAPYHLLEQGHNFNEDTTGEENDETVTYPYGIHWADMESGWVLLPEDFLRLVVFEMSDWERPVYAFITPADPQYKKQRSRVKAIRGTAQRPVCALVVRPEGKALEFYSCKSEEAIISKAVYIPFAVVENGGVDISEKCYRAVVYTVAGLVLETRGELDKAKEMLATAEAELNK